MLVLSRKRNEQIVVTPPGDVGRLCLTVVDIRGDKVRIGCECPAEWGVHRWEVQEAIERQQLLAGFQERLLSRIRSFLEDRQQHGLPHDDPDVFFQKVPRTILEDPREMERTVLYVHPEPIESFAHAYGLPVPMEGGRMRERPAGSYILFLEDPQDWPSLGALREGMVEEIPLFRPLTPLEVLVLLRAAPDLVKERDVTAAGVAYAGGYVPTLFWEGGAPPREKVYSWVIHERPFQDAVVPVARHIVSSA